MGQSVIDEEGLPVEVALPAILKTKEQALKFRDMAMLTLRHQGNSSRMIAFIFNIHHDTVLDRLQQMPKSVKDHYLG